MRFQKLNSQKNVVNIYLKKYYPIDLGMRNAIVTRTGFDRGKKLATIVFHHLRQSVSEVCFWRDKGEVDFVVSTQKGITPIQVNWDGMKKRHTDALDSFYKAFPNANVALDISRENIEGFLEGPPQI